MVLVLLGGACATALTVVMATADSTTDNPSPVTGPPPSALGSVVSEAMVYDDLAQMQATSDLVVSGTVVAIKPGRTIGGPDGQSDYAPSDEGSTGQLGAIQLNEVSLRVEEWLGGTSKVDSGSQIVLEEEAPTAFLAPSSEIGDSGIYFVLEKADRPGAYVLSGSPGRFLRTGDSATLRNSNPEVDWAATGADQSFDELKSQIQVTQDDVERGEVEPAQPLG